MNQSRMDKLPNEILQTIFSFIDVYDLLQVERVCRRWMTLVEEDIWKKKTRITECDFDPNSPLVVQVVQFIRLLQCLPKVEYYCFPFEEWLQHAHEEHYLSWKAVQFRILKLEDVLKTMMFSGQIPVHMDALKFLERMRIVHKSDLSLAGWASSFRDKLFNSPCFECSYKSCQSVIIRRWSLGCLDQFVYYTLQRIFWDMKHAKEIIVEELFISPSSAWHGRRRFGTDPGPDDDETLLSKLSNNVDRFCILKVACKDVALSLENSFFNGNEFNQILMTIKTRRDADAVFSLSILADKLLCDNGIRKIAFGSNLNKLSAKRICSASEEDAVDETKEEIGLRRLLELKATSLCVEDQWSKGQLPIASLPCCVLEHLINLDISIKTGEVTHTEGLSLWDSILEVVSQKRLRFLNLTTNVSRWKPAPLVIPPPVKAVSLPCLESIVLHGDISARHLSALLLGARKLHRLSLNIPCKDGRKNRITAYSNTLIDAIGQKMTLTRLDLSIKGIYERTPLWLTPWLTLDGKKKRKRSQQSTLVVHLSEKLICAISNLIQLQSLKLDLGDFTDLFPDHALDLSRLDQDEEHLRSILPRLHVVSLCASLRVY